jgi:hypothetical protein
MTRFVALESGEISYHRRTSILHDKKTSDRYISSTELYHHIFLDNGKMSGLSLSGKLWLDYYKVHAWHRRLN